MALAYIKLGNKGKARQILEQMEELQKLDSVDNNTGSVGGGLMYALYDGCEIVDFPRVPSVAGTSWFILVKRALEDDNIGDLFWGASP